VPERSLLEGFSPAGPLEKRVQVVLEPRADDAAFREQVGESTPWPFDGDRLRDWQRLDAPPHAHPSRDVAEPGLGRYHIVAAPLVFRRRVVLLYMPAYMLFTLFS
jgi:hypothetical protein